MAQLVKNPHNAGDTEKVGLVLGSGRSPEEENGNPLQYSCLENSTDSLEGYVGRVAESQTRLKA